MRAGLRPIASAIIAIETVLSASAPRVAIPEPGSGPQEETSALSAQRRIEQENEHRVAAILERIGQRKSEPARSVFKNVRLPGLRQAPAEDFLTIMNVGYARALGVSCTHCHVEDDFASDAKRPKRAAREMAVMHRRINQELGKMKSLRGTPDERAINCAACHRGSLDPTKAQ